MSELKPCPENKSTQLEERLENLTTGINSMFDGQKILVNKAFLEHVRDDMTELLTLRRAQPGNEPLTCEGCLYSEDYYDPVPCHGCSRVRNANDCYRRKLEPEGGDR